MISDTHGLLRPEVEEALAGSSLILHAGDVGDPEILARLGAIAPVRAVRGNTDQGALGASLPHTDVVDLTSLDGTPSSEGRGPLAFLLHDLSELALDPASAGFRLVVFGHTHEPVVLERDGVVYFNPGSAGPERHGRPVAVGRVRVEGGTVEPEIVVLAERTLP